MQIFVIENVQLHKFQITDRHWVHGMENVSIPVVNKLKNSPTLAVSVPINISIKLGFVSVNGHRETYFVEAARRIKS